VACRAVGVENSIFACPTGSVLRGRELFSIVDHNHSMTVLGLHATLDSHQNISRKRLFLAGKRTSLQPE
jgi:hypothetical protein